VPRDSDRPNPGDSGLETAIQARLERLDSGNYRRNNRLVLNQFAEFVHDRDARQLDDIDDQDCRRYAQDLADRVRDDELAASSANTYYDIVRAWFSWCVRDGRLAENPADSLRATEDLPEDTGDSDRQFWSPEARDKLLGYMDKVADEWSSDNGDERIRYTAQRDRALIYVLAWSGARGAEIVRDPDDDERNGVTWNDVDLEAGVMTVLGKNREQQEVSLLEPARERLERYHRLLNPPADWPVFAVFHPPNTYARVREQAEPDPPRDLPEDDNVPPGVEMELSEKGPITVMRERGIAPQAMSLQAMRKMMKKRCDTLNVDIDGDYLKPHGGRRSLGHELYAEQAELAQEMLRHENIGTTHESYREVRAAERKEEAEDVLFGDSEESR
jgi:site-specific recombinase XerD